MSQSQFVFVVALNPDDAESAAAEYDSHDDIEDAVVERAKLRASNGKNPYQIFKVTETYEVACEVEVCARDKP